MFRTVLSPYSFLVLFECAQGFFLLTVALKSAILYSIFSVIQTVLDRRAENNCVLKLTCSVDREQIGTPVVLFDPQ